MKWIVIAGLVFTQSVMAQTTTERIAALEKRVVAAERRVADLEQKEQAYRRFILWQACRWNQGMDTAGPLGTALGFSKFAFSAGTTCPPANTRLNVPQ